MQNSPVTTDASQSLMSGVAGDATIAAIASPVGRGAVSLIRVSGADAFGVVDKVWRGAQSVAEIPARRATLGRIVRADGSETLIDQVLLTRFDGPASFTGENVVEIAGHGGVLVTQRLLEALLEAGAKAAGPGEFSQRAFVNGKLDLTQAEAVMDLIEAQTDLALRAAHQQLDGGLGSRITAMQDDLLGVLAHVEAYIDFPDEDIDPDTRSALISRIDRLRDTTSGLLETHERGRILRHGLRLVFAGAPNVGKSSLLNVLLGYDRAIVSDVAGTTRDTVEEVVNLGGVPVRLIDTAGLRSSGDEIEHEGIQRTGKALASADLVVELLDGSVPLSEQERVQVPESVKHHLVALNKSDLGVADGWDAFGEDAVRISCTEVDGVEPLIAAIKREVTTSASALDATPVAINARHRDCLQLVSSELASARALIDLGEEPEFVAEHLRAALNAAGEVVGKLDAEDVLGKIFSSFCIGK
ncbi:tRNA uridine-5-carboxymethylaminomethyl(34) synthesis GTPase MnmE [Sulfuriroseicoccus oceanibius]|nr:tRNA uridine-5-carboxymethylaminomethyl(34) synthesis GTPase MnmE [Sulfuriroseicoccus oceanibius]